MKSVFTSNLIRWNARHNKREMPWKKEKDPYRIWLSEIILQQTRVEQGWSYYEKFITTFPNISALAKAPEKKVFKLWEGLGYYTRCRNLIATAKKIQNEYRGKFPAAYDELLSLKGIGPYTAAAIASFAFQLPYAVVDGNVQRVLSRYFGSTIPTDTTDGKNFYSSLAQQLLDKKQPGIYNQAIMDFGALICKPQNPLCKECVQSKTCSAFNNNQVTQLPVKKKKIQKKNRWLYYFIIESEDGTLYIRHRKEKDIWQHLYEFALLETGQEINEEDILLTSFLENIIGRKKFFVKDISKVYEQKLTHQNIQGRFIHIITKSGLDESAPYLRIPGKDIGKYPFPRFIASHIATKPFTFSKAGTTK